MSLLRLRDIHLAFGGPELLSGASLILEKGERVCLVGRNGAGKSTLLKIISGQIKPDSGSMEWNQGAKVAWLEQEVPKHAKGTLFDVVASGLGQVGELIQRYHHLTEAVALGDEKAFDRMESVQRELEAMDGWSLQSRVETTLSKLDLQGELEFEAQSGGVKRRVLLARALVQQPDILLLDEPTNHLDIESIQWLEEFLLNYRNCVLFITHDRSFLSHLATRIIDLDRGQLTSWPGNYETYLQRKAEHLEAEAAEWQRFDKKLSQEETWIRQGIKARRTRNEGRVRALEAMRRERSDRRERLGTVNASIQQAELSGKKVIEAQKIHVEFDGKTVIDELSTLILRGDRIGIIGPNGVGKSTLIRVLLGQMKPTSGSVQLGTNVEIAYFDQMRAQLDESLSVRENVGQGSDTVTINGQHKHIMGYLQDFLFSPERAQTPVKALSGGERNRLLLAKLFTQPSNLMVLDEPTNDLDIETLELLEELITSYQGTLIIVSHDRQFLNNIVTGTLVFEGKGKVNEYVGGYEDWLRQSSQHKVVEPKKPVVTTQPNNQQIKVDKKLSYKDQRTLEQLPKQIEQLEAELQAFHGQLADPSLYQSSPEKATKITQKSESLSAELERLYETWEKLEQIQSNS